MVLNVEGSTLIGSPAQVQQVANNTLIGSAILNAAGSNVILLEKPLTPADLATLLTGLPPGSTINIVGNFQ